MSTELITSGLFDNIDLSQITNMEIDGETIIKIAIVEQDSEYTIWPLANIELSSLKLYNQQYQAEPTTDLILEARTNAMQYNLTFDENYINELFEYVKEDGNTLLEMVKNNISLKIDPKYYSLEIDWNYGTSQFYLSFTNTNYTNSYSSLNMKWLVYKDQFGNEITFTGTVSIPTLKSNTGDNESGEEIKRCPSCNWELNDNGECTNPDCSTNSSNSGYCSECEAKLNDDGTCSNNNCPTQPWNCSSCGSALSEDRCTNPECEYYGQPA